MTDGRTTVLALLCLAGVLVALPVLGAASANVAAPANDAGTQTNNSTSMGAEISAFMQSSASETDGSVDDGMFAARYDGNGSDRAALVRNRTDRLRSDLEQLRAEKRALRAEKDNVSRVEYQARMSRLVGEIRSLERSANRTEPLAASAGVNTTALDGIRANASAMSGEEVSALARSLAVVPEHVEGGPPEERPGGPPADGDAAGNESDADGDDTRGPPDDRGSGDEGGGQSGDRGGNADDSGTGGGSGDGSGGPKAVETAR